MVKINLKSGNIILKNNQVAGAFFVLDMTSIKRYRYLLVKNNKIKRTLKNGDFFEVENSRLASFTITSVKLTMIKFTTMCKQKILL